MLPESVYYLIKLKTILIIVTPHKGIFTLVIDDYDNGTFTVGMCNEEFQIYVSICVLIFRLSFVSVLKLTITKSNQGFVEYMKYVTLI